MLIVALVILLVAIQLSDSYLRYLSFRDGMTVDEKKFLLRNFLILSIICGVIYYFAFTRYGITSPLYKAILIGGCFPWLAVFMLTIKRNTSQHVFIFGMSSIWSTMQHNWSAIAVVMLFPFGTANEVIITHALLYPLLFLVCLPVERKLFTKLLPPKKFFDSYGKLIAFFPFLMTFGVLVLWAQEPMIHTWQERFSRFYLPFVFFFFYRHILITTEQLNEQQHTTQNLRRMNEQIHALEEYNRLIQENREKVAVMRHDLRHNYRLIYMMIQAGKFEAAKQHIESQEKLLVKTAAKIFCTQPLINISLLIYIRRAESLGIKVQHKINLPEYITVDESDLALLISNLLENAIDATLRQPRNRRGISITVQTVEKQFVLEVSNYCDEKIIFDEKNLPYTSREGHGLGMASVKIFADKYNAYTDFSQESGIFKVSMYWTNLRR